MDAKRVKSRRIGIQSSPLLVEIILIYYFLEEARKSFFKPFFGNIEKSVGTSEQAGQGHRKRSRR